MRCPTCGSETVGPFYTAKSKILTPRDYVFIAYEAVSTLTKKLKRIYPEISTCLPGRIITVDCSLQALESNQDGFIEQAMEKLAKGIMEADVLRFTHHPDQSCIATAGGWFCRVFDPQTNIEICVASFFPLVRFSVAVAT